MSKESEDPRISEIRAVLDEWWTNVEATSADGMKAIRRILDRPASAPRVFLPGDTVPAGVTVTFKDAKFTIGKDHEWRVLAMDGPVVEVPVPSPEEWQAAVDRARAERADAEWQHAEGTNP